MRVLLISLLNSDSTWISFNEVSSVSSCRYLYKTINGCPYLIGMIRMALSLSSVAGQLSKQASSLLSNDTIACNYQSTVEESTSTTIPVPNFTVVGKSVHFALQWSGDDVDRLTSSFNKKGLMSREDYNDLCSSIERIHGYLQKTVKPDNIEEYASGLEKLLNSGHITNDQAKAYKKQYNIG